MRRLRFYLALLTAALCSHVYAAEPATQDQVERLTDLVLQLMAQGGGLLEIFGNPAVQTSVTAVAVGFATKWLTNSVKYSSSIRGWHTRLLAGCIAAAVSAVLTYVSRGQFNPGLEGLTFIRDAGLAGFLGWWGADTHARNKALGKRGRKRTKGLPADAVVKPPGGVIEVVEGVTSLAKELSKVVGLPAPLAEMIFPFLSQNAVRLLTESRTRPLTGPEMKQLIRATQDARVQALRELKASEGEDGPPPVTTAPKAEGV